MGKVIAISNQKGGTGKTTTTLNLGVALGKEGKKVLVIDMDPQSHLTLGFGFDPDKLKVTIADILLKKISDDSYLIPKEQYILMRERIHIIPSDANLAGIENILVNTLGREYILKCFIEEIRNDYDYILIDCLPSLGMLFINALAAADSVIIPLQAHYFPLKGMELLFKNINEIRKKINRELKIDGILLTMFKEREILSKSVKQSLEEIYRGKINIFDTKISYSVKAAESPAMGTSIFEYQPNGVIAENYSNLAKEILNNG